MDENTLNDLLECSVCLERLDTTSKVLPCQHTFCRKCLEIIVASRGELRCPECRVLIEIKIDDLPPNVLLMRILGGMKSVAQHNPATSNPTVEPAIVQKTNQSATEHNATQTNHHHHHQRSRPSHLDTTSTTATSQSHAHHHHPPPALISNGGHHFHPFTSKQYPNSISLPHARALFDFASKENGDLSFKKGDHIVLRKRLDLNWYVGEVGGTEGAFPVNHVQIIVPLPQPQCKALYDFRMGPNEEEGCLTFKKGAIINVFRRVDQNWAEGRFGDCIGIFPIAFVEMNGLAKQIMENGGSGAAVPTAARNVPTPPTASNIDSNSSSSDSSSTLTNSTCSNSSSSTSSTPTSPTAQVVVRQSSAAGAKSANEHKRHSFNVLTSGLHTVAVAGSSLLQSNRHSAEILCAPDPPEVANKSKSPQPSQSSQPDNKSRTHTRRSQPNMQHEAAAGGSNTVSGANSRTTSTKIFKTRNPSGSVTANYIALFPYKPQKSDELELSKGSIYQVTERCQDGWFKGTNRHNKSGVFPGNYVALLHSNRDHNKLMNLKRQSTIASSSLGSHNINGSSANQAASAIGHGGDVNTAASNSSALMPPPRLPPRSSAPTTNSESVWTKPLGKHVESFFSRKSSHAHNKSIDSSCHKDKKESSSPSAVSLMKRLTNIKRSKSPTASSAYSMDNPVFEDCSVGASGPMVQKRGGTQLNHVHVRSGSCPSQLLQTLPMDVSHMPGTAEPHPVFGSHRIKGHKERPHLQGLRHGMDSARGRAHFPDTSTSSPVQPQHSHSRSHIANSSSSTSHSSHHRKSHSLDATTIASHLAAHQANKYNKPSQSQNNPKERFRCIVPYPPNSEFELELQLDDIVFVHKKRENGWYKGTHSRTGKIGLFPASFVQKDE